MVIAGPQHGWGAVELEVASHPQLTQNLLMAPEDANWRSLVTAEKAMRSCVQREVVGYEPHVEAMVERLNSTEAACVCLCLHEYLTREQLAIAPWFGDSGCRVYTRNMAKNVSMLKAIERGLKIPLPMAGFQGVVDVSLVCNTYRFQQCSPGHQKAAF